LESVSTSLSLSLKSGILKAPGICPVLNSEGDLTSQTGMLSASSRNLSALIFFKARI
jgi:hypothetical protein